MTSERNPVIMCNMMPNAREVLDAKSAEGIKELRHDRINATTVLEFDAYPSSSRLVSLPVCLSRLPP